MNLKNLIKIFSHILVWSIIFIIPMYVMSKEGTYDYGPYLTYICKVVIYAIIFYINYLLLIDKFLFSKKLFTFFCINLVLVVILLTAQNIVSDMMRPAFDEINKAPPFNDPSFPHMRDKGKHPGPPFAMRFFMEYMIVFFIIGLSVAIKMTIRWYRDSINIEQIKNTQLEADLRNLRNQLNPHFLFNTLNNIYSLIAIDQAKAQESVHRLSGLLRYVLYENNQNFVPISKELEFTKNYIDLMKLRVGSNVRLNVDIENNGSQDQIASLMFMTLIENAFKHGINANEDSFIDIRILIETEKGVICTVENSLNDNNSNIEKKNSGIGLTNLTKRLELLYPNNYQFETERRQNSFFVMLRINFQK
ncbi:MAG: sensor histidine kinase [Dysgonomonas sp.]